MRIMTRLAPIVLAGLAGVAQAEPAGKAVDALKAGALPTSYTQFRGYGYRRGPGVGAAAGAGPLGFTAGAVIGSAAVNAAARPVAVYDAPVYARPVAGAQAVAPRATPPGTRPAAPI